MTTAIIFLIFISCNVQKNSLSNTFTRGDTIFTVKTKNQLSMDKDSQRETFSNCLLCQVRNLPGIDIGSSGSFGSYNEDSAEIYIKGTQSVKFQMEVTFYLDGNRIGTYSQLSLYYYYHLIFILIISLLYICLLLVDVVHIGLNIWRKMDFP